MNVNRLALLCACAALCTVPATFAQPVATPTTAPIVVVPTRPSDEAAAKVFDLFNQINALCREGKIDEAAKLVKPRKGTTAEELKEELKELGDEQKEANGRRFVSVDAKAQDGVAMLIIGTQREGESVRVRDALGAIKLADGSWQMLMEEPEDYDEEGELTADQKKGFAALAPWAEKRRQELSGKDD